MEKWKEILVDSSHSILQTMQIIDKNAMQIAIVVDKTKKLLGTVTDGDIRRGILKGIPLESSVEKIMNVSPKREVVGKSPEHYRNILRLNKLKQLPLVTNDGIYVNLFSLDSENTYKRNDNVIVLMAGGLGTRLRPLTDEIPKPLLSVGGKPILEHIIQSFKNNGFYQFIIAVNYKKELIESHFGDGSEYGVDITYLHEEKRLGTAGALSLVIREINKPFFVMNGDLLTKINFEQLLAFHIENRAIATMCVRNYEYQIPYGVIKTQQHRLIGIEEKPIHHSFVNAGIYVLDPELLHSIPYNEFYDMPELFTELIAREENVQAFPIREYWMDIGQMKDYEQAEWDLKNLEKIELK
jgi:dTDP-glucose pyrophosphorylase